MIDRASKLDYHTFRFKDSDITSYFPEQEFREVIETDAFKRLKSIHFLGSIDYLLARGQKGVGERHTRFDHSLAVASLAKRFALAKGLAGQEYTSVVVAALLHDIGHAPLSHSLEPSFKNIFEINHHLVGERILRGEVRLGVKLEKVLNRSSLNNFEIMSLVSGHGQGISKEPFARAINVDTIEGIIRSASYLHRKEMILNPISVLDAFVGLGHESHEILDEFWQMKDYVYSKVIQSQKGLIADFMCKKYMEIHSDGFNKSYYYGTEAELRRDHGALFEALRLLGKEDVVDPHLVRNGEQLKFTKRNFVIDRSVVLRSYADIDRRYLQEKSQRELIVKKRGGDHAHRTSKHPTSESLF